MDPCAEPTGIAAVAARIHERAVVLANEQAALQEAENELAELGENLAEEEKRSQQVRIKYLKSMVQLHSVELEYRKMQDQISERESKTKKLRQEENEIVEQIAKEKVEWDSMVQNTLVKHKVCQELYQKHLQGAIHARNDAMARRQDKLRTAARLCQKLKHDRDSILQQEEQVQDEMKRMTETEEEANKQVEALALQVRSALGKVRGHDMVLILYA
jgi:chromosome segregation ATPase